MFGKWQALPLWARVLAGLGAGLVCGLILGPAAENLKPIGDLFIQAIKMLIVPLIFISLIVGVTSMEDMARMGRIGVKTIGLYLLTTAIAVAGGLIWANLLAPGQGVALAGLEAPAVPPGEISLIDLVLGIVPGNPIEAMATGNVLQVIFFALLTGLAINAVGAPAQPVRQFFNAAADVIYKITHWVMETAPYGVFALIAWVAGTNGIGVLKPLAMLILTLYGACLVHMLVVSGLLVGGLARLNVRSFFRGIRDAQLVAYSTSTSSGTLPVTLTCAQENLGISRGVSSFVLPVGATMNMDGTALYMGIIAVFTAQAIGVPLGIADYGAIILTATLASIGTAGVPSAGLIMIPLVLGTVGLPIEVIALVAGIDRVLDMMRTATNVTGDAAIATVVAKSEGELDKAVYDYKPVV